LPGIPSDDGYRATEDFVEGEENESRKTQAGSILAVLPWRKGPNPHETWGEEGNQSRKKCLLAYEEVTVKREQSVQGKKQTVPGGCPEAHISSKRNSNRPVSDIDPHLAKRKKKN